MNEITNPTLDSRNKHRPYLLQCFAMYTNVLHDAFTAFQAILAAKKRRVRSCGV
jgi:hypothetical protein